MPTSAWIFAYGSLIFRPDFAYVERRRASARGYARRFFQGSPDHRGTPEDLGRVVTLVAEPEALVHGIAYRLQGDDTNDVLAALDAREQGGYERALVPLLLEDQRAVDAITWIALPHNPWWLGAEADHLLVERIRRARGPSGPNAEYVVRLRAALREHGITDEHVEALADALQGHH